ncbi:Glycine/D-amino acid oxidase [Palleronia salina]|uniref:Glycine/D-amino acid oxidase n=1 Tax=Palleronia salina TaxID=313368 RepID=A0A1M6ELV7_9RHOB|nr:FAD-dependent oxidoreductase [Palleronia salina]SHI86406.1 Glycine/D-amino acid oxidase [Palleronia salina]
MQDVTVYGAGIFGLSVAWACLTRGARVQVIDPHGPGAGASGGIVGALAPHVPENWNPKKAFQFDSLLAAEGFWAAVENAGGVASGYGRTGRIQPVADPQAHDRADARGAGAQDLWRGQAAWSVTDAASDPWGVAAPLGVVIHDSLTARIHPRRACDALVAAIRARGGAVLGEGAARGAVVWATGAAGLQDLSRELGQEVGRPIKGQAALLKLDTGDAPQLFVDGLHVVPHADGTVAIGSTTERDYDDPSACDALLDDVVARARTAVPRLAEAPVIARWAGLRPRARSRAPMLGAWPGRPGHYVANGGFKIGFGMAPGVAGVMADLVLEGRNSIPEGFRVADSLR